MGGLIIRESPDQGTGWVRIPARPPYRELRWSLSLVLQTSTVEFDSQPRYQFGSVAQTGERRPFKSADDSSILSAPTTGLSSNRKRYRFPKPAITVRVRAGPPVTGASSNGQGLGLLNREWQFKSARAYHYLPAADEICDHSIPKRFRYLRRRSASFVVALRPREALNSSRPASESDRHCRHTSIT